MSQFQRKSEFKLPFLCDRDTMSVVKSVVKPDLTFDYKRVAHL